MRRLKGLSWLLAFWMVFSLGGVLAQDEEELPETAPAVLTADLHLRASPSADAYLLTTLHSGTTVLVIGRSGNWLEVYAEGQLGWVTADYVSWQDNPDGIPNPYRTDGETVPFNAYVTTQDNASFRPGPGLAFERTRVLPPGTTMPAIGRTADGNWIQVVYNGEYGWIYYTLLIWSGDVIELNLDGVNPAPFVRRTLAEAVIGPDTPVFSQPDLLQPDVVGLVGTPTRVELTGRLGSAAIRRLQFNFGGRYYWVLNLDVEVYGTTLKLPDLAANAPYGRLLGNIRTGVQNLRDPLSSISSLWNTLASGGTITCDDLPRRARGAVFLESDLQTEPQFRPAVQAFETAFSNTNAAIDALDAICAQTGEGRFVQPEQVQQALDWLDSAERNLYIAGTFFSPLAERDPLLGN